MKPLPLNSDYILLTFMKMEVNKMIGLNFDSVRRLDLKLNDVEETYISVQSILENKEIRFNRFLVR